MASVTIDWAMKMYGARQYMPALPDEWLTPTMETFNGLTEKEAALLLKAARTYTGAIGPPTNRLVNALKTLRLPERLKKSSSPSGAWKTLMRKGKKK